MQEVAERESESPRSSWKDENWEDASKRERFTEGPAQELHKESQ